MYKSIHLVINPDLHLNLFLICKTLFLLTINNKNWFSSALYWDVSNSLLKSCTPALSLYSLFSLWVYTTSKTVSPLVFSLSGPFSFLYPELCFRCYLNSFFLSRLDVDSPYWVCSCLFLLLVLCPHLAPFLTGLRLTQLFFISVFSAFKHLSFYWLSFYWFCIFAICTFWQVAFVVFLLFGTFFPTCNTKLHHCYEHFRLLAINTFKQWAEICYNIKVMECLRSSRSAIWNFW